MQPNPTNIGTKDFPATWSDAVDLWRTHDPAKRRFWAKIAEAMATETPAIADRLGYSGDESAVRLVKACRALAEYHGGEFFLGCRMAGEIIGADRMAGNRLLKMLEADGVLVLLEKGRKGRASIWEYHGEPREARR